MGYCSKGSQHLVPGGPQLGGGWRLVTHLKTCYVVLGVTKTRLDIIFVVIHQNVPEKLQKKGVTGQII